jgi:sirohydrochlorin cobaltochelatase
MAEALVLVGHGSARNPNTRLPLCHVVQEIKRRGHYDEVRCGLLKQEPRVCNTLDPLTSGTIIIVPFFISDGYYTRNVIPCCLGLGKETPGRRLIYTRAIGSHPLFADLLVSHAREAGWTSGDALVVLGHGTPKNPASGVNVYLQADRIRRRMPGEEILTSFIDEPPFVTKVWSLTQKKRIFIVPLFVGDGWHVTETIPEDLGLNADFQAEREGRRLVMTSAVGTDPGLVEVILEIAREAEEAAQGER